MQLTEREGVIVKALLDDAREAHFSGEQELKVPMPDLVFKLHPAAPANVETKAIAEAMLSNEERATERLQTLVDAIIASKPQPVDLVPVLREIQKSNATHVAALQKLGEQITASNTALLQGLSAIFEKLRPREIPPRSPLSLVVTNAEGKKTYVTENESC